MKENIQGCLIVIAAVFLATLMIYSLTGCTMTSRDTGMQVRQSMTIADQRCEVEIDANHDSELNFSDPK